MNGVARTRVNIQEHESLPLPFRVISLFFSTSLVVMAKSTRRLKFFPLYYSQVDDQGVHVERMGKRKKHNTHIRYNYVVTGNHDNLFRVGLASMLVEAAQVLRPSWTRAATIEASLKTTIYLFPIAPHSSLD